MAVAVHHGLKPSSGSQRCRLQSFTHLDYTLTVLKKDNLAHSSNQASEPLNFQRCFSTPCLSLGTKVDEDYDVNPRIEILGGSRASDVRALVVEVAIAIASGVNPLPISGGLGGVYYMHGRNGRKVAIAKPVDEEPLAFNNPKGFGGLMLGQPGLKRSVRIGETGVRELAAYLLDHDGFSGVPTTALVKICHVPFHVNNTSAIPASNYKIASLQRFVDHDFDAGEMGTSCFSVASVHKIGILDVRLLNLDRHSGNILTKKSTSDTPVAGSIELVPIDHGLCLPEWIDDPYFEWLHWPQASVPFSESECEYISSLDPFKDAELLRNELPSIRESSVRVLILCTILLKKASEAGLCLADIGEMMTRNFSGGEEKCSVLEELCLQCKASLPGEMRGCEDKAEETHNERMQFEMETEETVGFPEFQETRRGMFEPSKVLRLSSVQSLPRIPNSPLLSIRERDDGEPDAMVTDDVDNHKQALMNRSMSFSVPQHMNECEGTSFGDMSEDKWGLFLENFEKLLPELIEYTKSKGSKQRLGTSCEFIFVKREHPSIPQLTSPRPPMTTTVTIADHELPHETHNLYTLTVSVAGDPAPATATFTCLLTSSPTHLTDWLAALPLPPPGPAKTVVGFDVEWRPNTSPRDDHPIATVQLHLLETHSVVFQILHSPSVPKTLIDFLNDERLVFVGVGIEEDIEKLLCDYGLSVKAEVRDLRIGEGTRGLGLAGLAKKVLGMDVVKNRRVGMSRWDMLWLNSDQVKYACFDAFLSWKIGEALLNGKPDDAN